MKKNELQTEISTSNTFDRIIYLNKWKYIDPEIKTKQSKHSTQN